MKIKTLFIAPYSAMAHLIEECRQEEQKLDIHIEVGNLHDAIPLAKAAENRGFDVIISRGGTAKLIEKEVNIPVVDVHVSGYDMLRVLTLANDFPGRKAIVGFSNITLGAKAITDLLDIPIEVHTVETAQEVETIVEQLKTEGCELIMGDVITIDAASKHNLEGILIQSGREAIFEAFQKARSIYRLHQKQQKKITLLKNLLEESASDMIVISVEGKVVYQNWTNFDGCPRPIDTLIDLVQQGLLSHGVKIVESSELKKIKQKVNEKVIDDQTYYLFQFSEFNYENQQKGLQLQAVSQQPMLIAKSKKMQRCVNVIESNLTNNRWILVGASGSGKILISQYIHYLTNGGNGLFASSSAENAIKMNDIDDLDIHTIYINEVEVLSPQNIEKLAVLIKDWAKRGITVITAIQQEDPVFHSLMYDDEVIRVTIPSLNERKEDIKPLTTYFIASLHGELGTSAIKIKNEAMELLEHYSWPGNVAELKTLLKDAVLEEKGYVIGKELISELLGEKHGKTASFDNDFLTGTLDEIEKRIILKIMEEENQNQTKAAERLGINRSTLWRKLKQ
ncbi:sigma-54-dependent transcriptional regulator [Metabacillus bambusae]|uniref:PrpR N-terminal domain-containing protein n=1 Tax=Metabacillus bambusae TaxID=2795218 RepID=A0ABS3N0Y2_9BACI|nr:sigma-54-dependent transcriptional regulator [Metabacillus bambusae]MBO1511819.1 PrpR N-terminal domain-containing protein [Metabacillus bambusae]